MGSMSTMIWPTKLFLLGVGTSAEYVGGEGVEEDTERCNVSDHERY